MIRYAFLFFICLLIKIQYADCVATKNSLDSVLVWAQCFLDGCEIGAHAEPCIVFFFVQGWKERMIGACFVNQ